MNASELFEFKFSGESNRDRVGNTSDAAFAYWQTEPFEAYMATAVEECSTIATWYSIYSIKSPSTGIGSYRTGVSPVIQTV
jgi:hypothetical protein